MIAAYEERQRKLSLTPAESKAERDKSKQATTAKKEAVRLKDIDKRNEYLIAAGRYHEL